MDDLVLYAGLAVVFGIAMLVMRLLGLALPRPPLPGFVMMGTMLTATIIGLLLFNDVDLILLVAGACSASSLVIVALVHRSSSGAAR